MIKHGTKNGVIYNSDCFDVLKELESESISMVITDPPYGMNFMLNWKHGKRPNKDFGKIEGDDDLSWLPILVNEIFRLSKPDTAHYCFCSKHKIDVFKQEIEKRFTLKDILVWAKHDTGMGDIYHNFSPKTEFILFFQKGKRKINGNRSPNLLTFHATHNEFHPTQKPVDLIEFLIKKFSNENELILDPFAGSGTTAIACTNTNRQFICIEKDPKYYKVAVERLTNGKDLKSPHRLFKGYNF